MTRFTFSQPGERNENLDDDVSPHRRRHYADDAETAPGRRFGTGTVVAGAVALICAGGLWYAYSASHHPTADADAVQLIRADESPTKHRPDDAGGQPVSQDAQDVYNMGGDHATVEHLLPAPEAPLPKPVPPADNSDGSNQVASVPAPSAPPGTAAAPPVQATSAPAVAAQPVTVAPPAPAAEAQPHLPESALKVAEAAAPSAAAPSSGSSAAMAGTLRVQIAATKDEATAQHEWDRLTKAHPDLLGSLTETVARADLGDRGVFYRVQAGPLPNAAAANKLCDQLKAVSIGCLIVKSQ